jgi:hypothetical protein
MSITFDKHPDQASTLEPETMKTGGRGEKYLLIGIEKDKEKEHLRVLEKVSKYVFLEHTSEKILPGGSEPQKNPLKIVDREVQSEEKKLNKFQYSTRHDSLGMHLVLCACQRYE